MDVIGGRRPDLHALAAADKTGLAVKSGKFQQFLRKDDAAFGIERQRMGVFEDRRGKVVLVVRKHGEVVKAFVSLKQGFEPTEALRLELIGHARKRLGAAVAPKEIAFLPVLPRTRSGKIMRRLLKARELGLPEGDTSTLEAGA